MARRWTVLASAALHGAVLQWALPGVVVGPAVLPAAPQPAHPMQLAGELVAFEAATDEPADEAREKGHAALAPVTSPLPSDSQGERATPRQARHALSTAPSAKGPASVSPSSETGGASTTLLGTTPLRALLLAVSADAAWLSEPTGAHSVHYATSSAEGARRPELTADAGTPPRFRLLLQAFLSRSLDAGSPDLAGTLELDVRDDASGEPFTLRCDERVREGSVHFAEGRTVTIREHAAR